MDYQPPSRYVTGGKSYRKLRNFSISDSDCRKADRRLISIRHQSELQRSTVGKKNISASPVTVFWKREQSRQRALRKCEEDLKNAKAFRLCYDSKIINKIDRYMLLRQCVLEEKKYEKVVAVKTFEKGSSVNAEAVFAAIMENTNESILRKVYSVMSNTTALNTRKASGVNKQLTDFYKSRHHRNIHSLECLFHVNEIYLTHIIAKIEGTKKGPGAMREGALMKHFSEIEKPDMSQIVNRKKLQIPVTNMAARVLQAPHKIQILC